MSELSQFEADLDDLIAPFRNREREAFMQKIEALILRANYADGFKNAIEYDKGRTKPASEEAQDLWHEILNKPHWALPTIQSMLDQIRNLEVEVAKLREFHRTGRYNVIVGPDGISVCLGLHDKNEPCDYTKYIKNPGEL